MNDPYDQDEPDTPGDPILSGQSHHSEWTRDIPRGCVCSWEWNVLTRAYDLTTYQYGCPWHSGDTGA